MNQNYSDPERIPSGIEGLDILLRGGIIKNSVNTYVGCSGSGKTIAALAFLYEGLLKGDHTLFLSFKETPSKMIKEAKSIGLDISELSTDPEDLIHLVENEKIVEFMTNILPALAQKLKHRNIKHTRIILDSLDGVLWEFPSEKEQRKVLTKIYLHLSSLGTVVQTVEETDARIPIYLSDNVIRFQNKIQGEQKNQRLCSILKSRGTNHIEGEFQLELKSESGMIINVEEDEELLFDNKEKFYSDLMKKIKKLSKSKDPKKRVIAQIAKNLLGDRETLKDRSKTELDMVELITDKRILESDS